MKNTTTSDDILGKEAVDPSGGILGVVVKMHINTSTKQILGLTVDTGLTKPDLFIGINFISHFGKDAVLLKKVPEEKFKGMRVLTTNGIKVGNVNEIVMENNDIKEFIIKSRKSTLLKKKLVTIPYSEVKEIGASIILKKDYKPKEE